MYHNIHRLHRNGLTPYQIASHLSVDFRTVKKFLAKNEQEYLDFQKQLLNRKKKLEPYEDYIMRRLRSCQKASTGQIHHWLKEQHQDFPSVSVKTVYNFVMYVRKKYQLPKICKTQ